MVIGGMKVVAVFYQFGSQGLHGSIFLPAVSVGHHYDGVKAEVPGGESLGLSMISAGGGDNASGIGMGAAQPVHKDDPAPDFESA